MHLKNLSSMEKNKHRFEQGGICKECHEYGINCQDGKKCAPIRTELRDYNGIRKTADGFDCALPVTIDSHSNCSYECLYCFSDNILGHATAKGPNVGQTSLGKIEAIFDGRGGSIGEDFRRTLKYDRRNANGFPTAVQLGGLCDPCDSIEQNQGWLLKFIELAIKYNQPVRMSTKGALFLLPEYQRAISKAPHLFWIAFSIITPDDHLLRRVDRFAPDASTRLRAMKALHDLGVKTSLRLRPILCGITDYKRGHERLIRKAAEAGANAISYEVGFYPMTIPKDNKWKWNLLQNIAGQDYKRLYSNFGKLQACTRPSYLWTENIMHEIKSIALDCGLDVGVSDPVWKQLTDWGCCCGIRETDPVFGNWEEENATYALLRASRGHNDGLIHFRDICPPWAKTYKASHMINLGAGPKVMYKVRHRTWEDVLVDIWDNPAKERSPMNYFQGALQVHKTKEGKPVIDEDGHLVYRYVGLQRAYMKSHWNTMVTDAIAQQSERP